MGASSISRTSSLPNLLDSSESDGTSSKDGDHKLKLTSPSPAPSEPCFSLKSTTSTSQAPQGPPKPPRDPNRVSSVDIRRNVPTFAMRNVAGSTTSLPAFVHSRTLTSSTPKDTEFIWKAPPAPFVSQNNLYENPPAAGPYSNSRRSTITQASTTDEVFEEMSPCIQYLIFFSLLAIIFEIFRKSQKLSGRHHSISRENHRLVQKPIDRPYQSTKS